MKKRVHMHNHYYIKYHIQIKQSSRLYITFRNGSQWFSPSQNCPLPYTSPSLSWLLTRNPFFILRLRFRSNFL